VPHNEQPRIQSKVLHDTEVGHIIPIRGMQARERG